MGRDTTVPTVHGTAAVTGASRGIGMATALELARRGRPVLALVEDGLAVQVAVLDVVNPGAFRFPDDLEVLVNNAGARRDFLPVEHIAPEDWKAVFDINVFAMAEMSRRAIPVLRENGGGVICNVTSSAVLDLGPFFGAYRCSKVAASALCEEMRLELAPFGTRVVEILPGPTTTLMANDGVSARVAEAVRFPEYAAVARRQRELLAQQPEWATPEDVAVVIADAIAEGPGPMRHGTDAISRRRLDVWRRQDDERFMKEAVERYAVPPHA